MTTQLHADATPATRQLTVLAQDPDVTDNGKALTTQVVLRAEQFAPGPRTSRLEVVDYDATNDVFYGEHVIPQTTDPYKNTTNLNVLVNDPTFHAQNTFGVVASTLFEFERALGRNLAWGFDDGHQLKIVPHAFQEPNAYYSKYDNCLAFGYFPHKDDQRRTIFTCLSHDIIAHEATHAILDGLRSQLMRPSSHDQAAFHEGFADIIALLKILKSQELVRFAVHKNLKPDANGTVSTNAAFRAIDKGDFLWGLAEEMGKSLPGLGRDALRNSIKLPPSPDYYTGTTHLEAHDRGEILVAAIMRTLLQVWHNRLEGKITQDHRIKPARRVAAWRVEEEGAKAASHLLHMMIRAIDYLPPVHVTFGDFLSAVVTADSRICPDDSLYDYRKTLISQFASYGIEPAATGTNTRPGIWSSGISSDEIRYTDGNIETMRWDPEGMFRFLWQNAKALDLRSEFFTRINSVRPVWRVGPTGFILRETVAEYYQLLKGATAADLSRLKIPRPDFMSSRDTVDLVGGGTLIFDEFGRLAFHIHNHINRPLRQHNRLVSLWQRGEFRAQDRTLRPFADMHRRRGFDDPQFREEGWD